MTLVVDASVAVRWHLGLDGADRADALLQSGEHLIAPDLVFPELSSAIWKSVIFASTSVDSAIAAIGSAADFFDEVVPSVALRDRALRIAIDIRHPVYDCFYLALAEQRDCRMVTADDRLIARCARTPFGKLIRPLLSAR